MNPVGTMPWAASSELFSRQRTLPASLPHTCSHSHVLPASSPVFQAVRLLSVFERPISSPMALSLSYPMTPSPSLGLTYPSKLWFWISETVVIFAPIISLLLDNKWLDGRDQSDFVRFLKNLSFVNFSRKKRCPENWGGGVIIIHSTNIWVPVMPQALNSKIPSSWLSGLCFFKNRHDFVESILLKRTQHSTAMKILL